MLTPCRFCCLDVQTARASSGRAQPLSWEDGTEAIFTRSGLPHATRAEPGTARRHEQR